VVSGAGGRDAGPGRPADCRDVLLAIREICHRVVLSPAISQEWDRHQSTFARGWRVSMEARRKVLRCTIAENAGLRDRLKRSARRSRSADAMIKDAHLLEAALATDRIVLSTDRRARAFFSEAAISVGEIGCVVWLDVDALGGGALTHVTSGFRRTRSLRLGAGQPG
jgi:hypothetical protein